MGILYYTTKDFLMKKIKIGNIFIKNIIQLFFTFNVQIPEHKKHSDDPKNQIGMVYKKNFRHWRNNQSVCEISSSNRVFLPIIQELGKKRDMPIILFQV